MKTIRLALIGLLFSTIEASAAVSIIQKNIQIPSSGSLVPGSFLTDGTNIWFGMDLYDGTTWATFNGDGGLAVHLNNSSIAVTGTFWQTTQPISAASLPLPTGAATSALQTTINTTLGSPFQAGGSIGNTSFGISGTLPAFAATPTVNLGTLNGAATAALQTTINTTLGSPMQQTGGSVTLASQYPSSATAVQGSATGTTAATSTTLAATASVTNYVCSISIRANATAATTGNATLSDGTKTFNFTQWTAPSASGVGIIEEAFNPCYPAAATNTAWTLTSAAPGTGGVVSVAIAGYQK